MTDAEATDRTRAKWRSYFEQIITGSDAEVEAATDGAMAAIARQEDQAGIIAAGRAAAKRYREGGRQARREDQVPTGQQRAPGMPGPGAGVRPSAAMDSNSGVVTGLQQRQEAYGRTYYQVWNFRLQRPHGQPIPVELRARSISGQIANGDVVRIPRRKKPMSLQNLTTGATISGRGKRHPFLRAIVLLLFALIFLTTAFLVVRGILTVQNGTPTP